MSLPTLDELVDADDVLLFYDPIDDTAIDDTYLPAGPVAPAGSGDTLIRVYNASDDYTATAVVVACAAADDDAATLDGAPQILVSADGTVFAGTCALGDLPPHAVSDAVTVRRITGPGTPGGQYTYVLTATAGGWAPAGAAAAGDVPADTGADEVNPDDRADPGDGSDPDADGGYTPQPVGDTGDGTDPGTPAPVYPDYVDPGDTGGVPADTGVTEEAP